MLPVSVKLHSRIISLPVCQEIPGLHRAADPQVLDEMNGVKSRSRQIAAVLSVEPSLMMI